MLKKRKAQGPYFIIILVVVIALFVLSIFITKSTERVGEKFNKDIVRCDLKGGQCLAKTVCNPPGKISVSGTNCEVDNPSNICCIIT